MEDNNNIYWLKIFYGTFEYKLNLKFLHLQ